MADSADQFDLSIDLDSGGSGGRRQIGSIRHGERAVLRSHDKGRLVAAANRWVHALVDEAPPTRLRSMNLALLTDGRTLAVPRWVTADSALMDRLLRGANWLDGAWVQLRNAEKAVMVVGQDGVARPLVAVVLDNGFGDLDLSTPARRAGAVFGSIESPDPGITLDVASKLALTTPVWHSVNTENIPAACRSIAGLLRD